MIISGLLEIAMFKTEDEENEQQNTVPGLHETYSDLFREPVGKIPWEAALKGKAAQEIWQPVFKDNHLQSYKQFLLNTQ